MIGSSRYGLYRELEQKSLRKRLKGVQQII